MDDGRYIKHTFASSPPAVCKTCNKEKTFYYTNFKTTICDDCALAQGLHSFEINGSDKLFRPMVVFARNMQDYWERYQEWIAPQGRNRKENRKKTY